MSVSLDTILTLNRLATDFFVARFPGSPAEAYVTRRGLAPKTIKKWQLGYAPAGWLNLTNHLEHIGHYTTSQLLAAGLVSSKEREDATTSFDTFRDRLMLPILAEDGETILGFSSRRIADLDESIPKYMNTATTLAFSKKTVFYCEPNLIAARAAGHVFVVEGNLDALTLTEAGQEGVVALCGTALSAEHLRRLAGIGKITLVLDADSAGMTAMTKALCAPGAADLDIGAIILPSTNGEKVDPDAFIRAAGFDAWRALVETRLSRWDALWAATREPYVDGLDHDDPHALIGWARAWGVLVGAQATPKESPRLFKSMDRALDLPFGTMALEFAASQA